MTEVRCCRCNRLLAERQGNVLWSRRFGTIRGGTVTLLCSDARCVAPTVVELDKVEVEA